MILLKFLTPPGYPQRQLAFFPKNRFPTVLGAILNFCVKQKNTFISETVQNRAFSAKFLTLGVSAESSGGFTQKLFSLRFGGHLKFLRKIKNAFISETLHF